MDTLIIAASGKKQSGKSSLMAYLQAQIYLARSHSSALLKFSQRPTGEIDWSNHSGSPVNVDQSNLEKFSKVYSFADALKKVAVDIIGLKPEQVYGTDEQKNSPTHVLWDNMPMVVRWMASGKVIQTSHAWVQSNGGWDGPEVLVATEGLSLAEYERLLYEELGKGGKVNLKSGPMTGREVLQVYGTDIMRKMFSDDVWVNATLSLIRQEAKPIALISDMRFRTEFHALHKIGAHVIRLERVVSQDSHSSEVDFDGFEFTAYPRTLVVPANLDIYQKNDLVWERMGHVLDKKVFQTV